jgi:hypothetical protein
MATIKKSLKKKDAGKPSTVLIIFLVFFILLSIGLGVFAYYGYEGQNKLREETANAKKAVTAAKILDDYRMGVIYFLSNSVGQDLEQEPKTRGVPALEEMLKDNGKYNTEPDRATFAKLFTSIKGDLAFNDAQKTFADNYRARLKQKEDALKTAESQLAATKKALADSQAQFTNYQSKIEGYFNDARAQIGKGNQQAFALSQQKFKAFDDLVKQNKEIQDQKQEAESKAKEEAEKFQIEIARLQKQLDEKKQAGLETVPSRRSTEEHALFLDISRGIPLWDRPLGKITDVDLDRRQAFINLGSDRGVHPGLTFNVFADDGKGNADKFMKGTLEVIRIIDGQTSLCRISSLYDASGQEIVLNDPTRGRAAREVDAGMRKNDLIFNMFWNQRVAIAGAVNFTGFPIDAPSEQMRQLGAFAQALERMGIHTDAYLDLTDGQAKGSYSNKTRFLILGEPAQVKNPNDAAQVERAKMINDGIAAMKKEALDKGMFVISADNFAIAAGYRKPQNATSADVADFRPSVPLAGAAGTGLVIQRERPAEAAAPMVEKKEPEAKEPEPKEKKEPEAKEKKPPEPKEKGEPEAKGKGNFAQFAGKWTAQGVEVEIAEDGLVSAKIAVGNNMQQVTIAKPRQVGDMLTFNVGTQNATLSRSGDDLVLSVGGQKITLKK